MSSPATSFVHVEVDRHGRIVASVIGSLDSAGCAALVTRLDSAPFGIDVLDLRLVSFVSAAGLGFLGVVAAKHRPDILASEAVDRMLELCDMRPHVAVHPPSDRPLALDHAQFGIGVHDAEMRYMYVNHALVRINGIAAGAHLGRHPSQLFEIQRDDVTRLMAETLSKHLPNHATIAAATPGGRRMWACTYLPAAYRTDDDVRVEAVVAIVADAPSSITGNALDFSIARSSPTAR